MEIIKITDSAIKISLLPSEAIEYDILNIAEGKKSEVDGSFSRLLKLAKEKVGIKWGNRKILAEIFSSKDGGYEIFISYLDLEEKMYKERNEQVTPRPKIKLVYSVEALDSLLVILGRIKKLEEKIKASVYYDPKSKKYYLILEDVSKKGLHLAFIGEYGRQVKISYLPYIEEYFMCISRQRAIAELSNLM